MDIYENLYSTILNERFSIDKYEWIVYKLPQYKSKVENELCQLKQRLEHCINFVMDDEIIMEGETVYIKSPTKENWILDKDNIECVKDFYSFYQCVQDKESIPIQIEKLQEILTFLEDEN
jgi:hypothetical protein